MFFKLQTAAVRLLENSAIHNSLTLRSGKAAKLEKKMKSNTWDTHVIHAFYYMNLVFYKCI